MPTTSCPRCGQSVESRNGQPVGHSKPDGKGGMTPCR